MTAQFTITAPELPGCTFFSREALLECAPECLAVQAHIDAFKRTGNEIEFYSAMLATGEFDRSEVTTMARTGKRIPSGFGYAADYAPAPVRRRAA